MPPKSKRTRKPNYHAFAANIDVDLFEEAIGWSPMSQQGDEDIGKCPDYWGLHKHGDQTGKFSINREKKIFNCWVCGGGNLLTLAMEYLECQEDEATEWLKQLASGEQSSRDDFVEKARALLAVAEEIKAEPYFNPHVLDQFEHDPSKCDDLAKFLTDRNISWEIAAAHGVCYVARRKKPAPMKEGEPIDEHYFGPCLIFPHYWKGRLVGWQHRWLEYPDTPRWLAKWTNTTSFPKENTLYNWDEAKKQDGVLVVESIATVLFLESRELNAVSTLGAGVKLKQIEYLRDFERVLLCPDNDRPGQKWVQTLTEHLYGWVELTALRPFSDLPEWHEFDEPGVDIGDLAKCPNPDLAIVDYIDEGSYDPTIRAQANTNRR